ncbi:PQQ-binding-like beta-propeller repeat protein [Paenibacillus montanisoli]|uniref:PQQ-binding-like beta-propeller repeat protein n=1 Tax=Paenibacillus montanisoli TaxID=2081970 RepID=UPI0030B7F866
MEIPLSGDKPAEHEKPIEANVSNNDASHPVLSVKIGPQANVASVQYQYWPDITYAGSNDGNWQDLVPKEPGHQSGIWETVVDTAGKAPGSYRIQLRVTNQLGELWDEAVPFEIPAQLNASTNTSRISWEFKLDASVQAGIVIAGENTESPVAIVGQLDGTVTALEVSDKKAKPKWTYRTQGAIVGTPALSSDGSRVFIGSTDHRIYAMDTSTGNLLWSYSGSQPILSSPQWLDDSHDGKPSLFVVIGRTLLKLDAATGAVLWTADIHGFFAGRPEIVDQTVFVASGDGKVSALDIRSGMLLWQKTLSIQANPYRTLLYSPWYCNPTALPDKQSVLFTTVSKAYALNAATGNTVWTLNGGYMYAGHSVFMAEPEPTLVLPDEWGTATAVNPINGSKRWTSKTKQRIFHTAPIFCKGIIYLTSVNGLMTGIDGVTGNIVDELQFSRNYVFSSPALLAGQMLIAAGHDGIVRGIRL